MNHFFMRIVGLKEIRANLRMYPGQMRTALCRELKREANDIVEDSTNYVPIISGQLLRSRYVTPIIPLSRTSCMVQGGYSAPYALKVHEDATRESRKEEWMQRYKYQQFGQWKYLEQPFLHALQGMLNRVARGMSGTRLGAVGRRPT